MRAGRLADIDIMHIAEEIEDVGRNERRELASRMVVLLTHLLKWQVQPGRRGSSWQRTIKNKNLSIYAQEDVPGLVDNLVDALRGWRL